ncbi:hypothetical protein [Georgenia sp. SUBG003]|uniref:hypothetical protein n=1 Tax=Georgenia sp. SUBG003 TaxID=1497974 RepID=UPI003AB46499
MSSKFFRTVSTVAPVSSSNAVAAASTASFRVSSVQMVSVPPSPASLVSPAAGAAPVSSSVASPPPAAGGERHRHADGGRKGDAPSHLSLLWG